MIGANKYLLKELVWEWVEITGWNKLYMDLLYFHDYWPQIIKCEVEEFSMTEMIYRKQSLIQNLFLRLLLRTWVQMVGNFWIANIVVKYKH